MFMTTILVQAAENEGLTIGKVLAGIPHDGPAILVYLLTAGAIALVWWGHRRASADASSNSSAKAGDDATSA